MMNRLIAPNDPRLRIESSILGVEDTKSFRMEFDNMFSIMRNLDGLGLAAPQIGINYRFFVMEKTHAGGVFLSNERVVINPIIEQQSSEHEWQEEGCLSLPGVAVNVSRPTWIKVYYVSITTVKEKLRGIEEELHGLAARVFCHEFDHLCGRLITDYLE